MMELLADKEIQKKKEVKLGYFYFILLVCTEDYLLK
jgi:hypothetical protein